MSARRSTTRRRFERCENSVSTSSRISERSPVFMRQGWSGRSSPSTLSESTSTGASGADCPITVTAVRVKDVSSLTTANSSPTLGLSFWIDSAESPPWSA